MMKVYLLVWSLAAFASGLHDSYRNNSYEGYQVFRISPQTRAEVDFLAGLQDRPMFDFWTEPVLGRTADVMVPPRLVPAFTADLAAQGLTFEVMIPDVQKLIELEKMAAPRKEAPSSQHAMTWDEYHSLEDMYSFLDYLEATYDFVTTETIGQTTEGRDMRVAKVCKGGCGSKPAVWIDGGIHAREWISPAAVTWMLRELVENDKQHSDLLESLNWYFLPSHNPDGYAFSRNSDRMWRRTRSDHGSLFGCKGVDANRNWGFHWNEGGSSNNKCSDTYHGPEAFSEPENVNVRDFILSKKGEWVFYNSVHSYSQLILLPWGYTSSKPSDYDAMYELAMKGSDALTAVHGKTYEVGCIPCLLYIASGSAVDWAHGEAQIGFTTSMELRDTGYYGFILPPEQIIPTSEEVWALHLTVIRELMTAQA